MEMEMSDTFVVARYFRPGAAIVVLGEFSKALYSAEGGSHLS